MEIIGYERHNDETRHIQQYVTTCPRCGAVLCFTDRDLEWSQKPLSLDKLVHCPKCCRQITVFEEKPGWFKSKIVLSYGIRAITNDEYAELRRKYDE